MLNSKLSLVLVLAAVFTSLPGSATATSSSTSTPSPLLFCTRSERPWRHSRPRTSLGFDNFSIHPCYGESKAHTVPFSSSFSCLCSVPTTWKHFVLPVCKKSQAAHIAGLVVWLLLLFYLLGTTASDYFSYTLERLSQRMRLSPALAGVTLLAIGNGAPDVFSSVAAFVSSDESGSIGFGSVLGGALFVTTVVSGSVALVTAEACKKRHLKINSACFIRDTLFLLTSAAILTVILLDGKVYLWEAIMFLCIYVLYAAAVWALEMIQNQQRQQPSLRQRLIVDALREDSLPCWSPRKQCHLHPHHHLCQNVHCQEEEPHAEHLLDNRYYPSKIAMLKHYLSLAYKFCIEWPLSLPRRLTIPMIEEDQWSRPLAVTSCFLGPLFLGAVWIREENNSPRSIWIMMSMMGCLGVVSGVMAFLSTESSRPPERHIWLWLTGGFAMSLVWFYFIASELVTSLETIGGLLNISPAILGLTVLAWGNGIGDLVADLALACSGRDGVQIAISGCYSGPLFNTVVGLGLSLVIACWKSSPEPLLIENDNSLFYIIGFLGAGLSWALVMMLVKGMQLSRIFGAGLVLLYCGFLVIGTCYAMGWFF